MEEENELIALRRKKIDALRAKMEVVENSQYTRDYLDPEKRSIGNSLQVRFKDGSSTDRVAVEYPIGHRRRRSEGIPVLLEKFERNLRGHIPEIQADAILRLCSDQTKLEATPVTSFMDMFVVGE